MHFLRSAMLRYFRFKVQWNKKFLLWIYFWWFECIIIVFIHFFVSFLDSWAKIQANSAYFIWRKFENRNSKIKWRKILEPRLSNAEFFINSANSAAAAWLSATFSTSQQKRRWAVRRTFELFNYFWWKLFQCNYT